MAEDDAPEPEPEGGEGVVDVVRREIGAALDGLFTSGKADVGAGASPLPPAPADKPLTAADMQRIAREEMGRAQAELRAKRQTKSAAKPAGAGDAGPGAPTAVPPPVPHTRGMWERFQHALWGEKD